MAVLAAVVGLAVGGLLIPYVNARQAQRREADSGLTMSQVLDLIVLASESGIAVVDEYRDVVLVNPRAEELGLVRDRLLDERAWSAVEKVLATGEDVDFDLTAKNPMPGRSRIAVRGVARALSREESTFVVLFGDDDSEQARMEATRRDFVANVSHELKTPVGAMSLLAEALLESADDPDSVRHFGQRLLAESRRMGKMVTELIALSRLQGAEKLPELETVDVDTVVNAAIERSRTAAEAAGITVSTDANSGLEILGDDTLLVTALSNLVENAINYSPKGSHVSVSRSLRGGYVNIAVTDRGIGIAKEDQERVFERFFRADKARSRATGGTGLGLAIVKHVAANHNGEIALWSKLGTGSTFTLRIPAVESEDQVSTVPVEKKSPAAIQAGKKETGARPVARARPNGVEATR
ncbi:Signal-transduction histidine kinase senX3 [Nocardia sp. RB56]|uniref:Sensor-like histidine kinase SenX3 n=2 Tax=Nocardia aurantia TaxID=2585199 RepID=A0A7K0DWN0_9NOCA|nr:Signal-transduction histidine kinase senX3 [Nocardia aurantia]